MSTSPTMGVDKTPISLIVSIGNPEARYLPTRHNAGHWLADLIVNRYESDWQACSIAQGELAQIEIAGRSVRLFKSGVAMNISGRAVARVANYYRILPTQMLVCHDELDFPPGVVRMKFAGSSGGHNGLKSIIESMSNNNNFWRCRIGIGHPPRPSSVIGFVLRPPGESEKASIVAALEYTSTQLADFIGSARERALTAIHSQLIPS